MRQTSAFNLHVTEFSAFTGRLKSAAHEIVNVGQVPRQNVEMHTEQLDVTESLPVKKHLVAFGS